MEWYRLKLNGLKSSKIRLLMNNYKRYRDLFKDLNLLTSKFNLDKSDTDIIINSRNCEKYFKFTEFLEDNDIGLIDINDYRYPENLKNIEKPPLFLFYKGDIKLLNNEKMIAIIGTRQSTKYGEDSCKKIIKKLVENKVVIVSGLAMGIDSIAHLETLNLKGKTISVLGCGIDIMYPQSNNKIRKQIEKTGVVISEFPLGMKALPQNFPIRNRIIAGLSKATVVIESSLKGGSLITANIALDENRDVFAVPGDIEYPLSKGCNELIKNAHAKLLTSGEDILLEYNWKLKEDDINDKITLIGKKLEIYNILKVKMHLEEIKQILIIETSELLSNLMELEIEGYIQRLPAGYYRRRA